MNIDGSHQVTVIYTIDDDGIHLQCQCGADIPCGFHPTPRDLLLKEQQHQLNEQS